MRDITKSDVQEFIEADTLYPVDVDKKTERLFNDICHVLNAVETAGFFEFGESLEQNDVRRFAEAIRCLEANGINVQVRPLKHVRAQTSFV